MNTILSLLNRAAGAFMDADPDTARRLSTLEGKVMRLNIEAPTITVYLLVQNQSLIFRDTYEQTADVILGGSLAAFARLASGEGQSSMLSEGRVTMSGDADVGQSFQKVLGQLDLDWEAVLSSYMGDHPARAAGNVVRGMARWASRSSSLTAENVADFLTEESHLLVAPVAMERFSDEVHNLRSGVDRLEQRLAKLEAKRSSRQP